MTAVRALMPWTVWLALGLSACGGGGSGPPPADVTIPLSGRVASVTAGVTVCVDLNRNLACDASEPTTRTDASGAFALSVPSTPALETLFVVAELRAADLPASAAVRLPTGTTAFTLAAPAAREVTLDATTTLTASVMQPKPELTRTQAEAELKQALGVGDLQTVEAVAWSALHDGSRAWAKQASSSATAAQATINAAAGVLRTLAKYVDKRTGRLLPTVTAKTVATEAIGAFATSPCTVQSPPLLRIATAASAPIVSKDDYVDARLVIGATADFPVAIDVATRIRGRGNSTWGMPKKPYKLKLDTKAALLGMPADTEWALLAHHADKTLLRNAVAMCLGRTMAMDYTPASRFVEVQLNGGYEGVYELYEHVKAGSSRIDIGSPAETDADTEAGFLLEIDVRLDAELWFRSAEGIPYTVQSDATPGQVAPIAGTVEQMEAAMFSAGYTDTATGYASRLDVESLIDFYLINELMRSTDSFATSTFVSRKRSGKLKFGPLWDFDIAAGNINYGGNDLPEGWRVREVSVYMKRLLTDPAFAAHVAARWQYLSSRLPAVRQFIDSAAVTLDAAQRRNFQRWDILSVQLPPNPVALGSHAAEVARLKGWLTQRATWMDAQLPAR